MYFGAFFKMTCSSNCILFQRPDIFTHLLSLVNLRKLDLSGNEISRIEGLQMCGQIEDLNLESNKIVKIEGLDSLSNLKKLEIGMGHLFLVYGLSFCLIYLLIYSHLIIL